MVPIDRRLMQLRALVKRLERLPASTRREWMLQEARARMVDVETGVEPRPMRAQEGAAPPPEPQVSGVRKARAGKRPSCKHAGSVAQPVVSRQRVPRAEPDPTPIAGSSSSAAMLGDELLWLGDPSGDTFAEPDDGSTEIAPWRRGLRG